MKYIRDNFNNKHVNIIAGGNVRTVLVVCTLYMSQGTHHTVI